MKHLIATVAAISLMTGAARANELGAALLGLGVGAVIANEANKNKRTQRVIVQQNSATRNYNAQTQTALNYFGFNAGAPDGVMGSRSRQAVRQYQAYTGFPVTGNLTQYERDFLICFWF